MSSSNFAGWATVFYKMSKRVCVHEKMKRGDKLIFCDKYFKLERQQRDLLPPPEKTLQKAVQEPMSF